MLDVMPRLGWRSFYDCQLPLKGRFLMGFASRASIDLAPAKIPTHEGLWVVPEPHRSAVMFTLPVFDEGLSKYCVLTGTRTGLRVMPGWVYMSPERAISYFEPMSVLPVIFNANEILFFDGQDVEVVKALVPWEHVPLRDKMKPFSLKEKSTIPFTEEAALLIASGWTEREDLYPYCTDPTVPRLAIVSWRDPDDSKVTIYE